jgi:hypothetical protein
MKERALEGEISRGERAKACLSLEVLDSTTNTLREVLKLVIEGAEVDDLSLAERKAKELYRTALNVWAKLKERQLVKSYGASRDDMIQSFY